MQGKGYKITELASCPWGRATAHGVGTLIKLNVIQKKSHFSHRAYPYAEYGRDWANGSIYSRL